MIIEQVVIKNSFLPQYYLVLILLVIFCQYLDASEIIRLNLC